MYEFLLGTWRSVIVAGSCSDKMLFQNPQPDCHAPIKSNDPLKLCLENYEHTSTATSTYKILKMRFLYSWLLFYIHKIASHPELGASYADG
jgi:hypothetical protein